MSPFSPLDSPLPPSPLPLPLRGKKKYFLTKIHFITLSQLKVEEKSPKIIRMQILRKVAPKLSPFTGPPGSPGPPCPPLESKNFFGRFLASIYVQPIPFGPKKQAESPVLVEQMHDPLCSCTVQYRRVSQVRSGKKRQK